MRASNEKTGLGRQAAVRALWVVRLLVLGCLPACCLAATASATQTLSASLSPIGKLQVVANLALVGSGTLFTAFSASMSANYKIRTTPSGSGSMTVRATSDFSPAGGPAISTGVLTYTCSGATLGTACSGTQTVSTAAQTPVVTVPAARCTGGGGAYCSSSNPNSVSLSFALVNDPQYKTGPYSAILTFTISAT
jgi:hypothetical protein